MLGFQVLVLLVVGIQKATAEGTLEVLFTQLLAIFALID